MQGTYLIISILVVASDGSWSVDVGWSLVLRMLRNERRRRLKVEGDIIFLFFYIYLFFTFLTFCGFVGVLFVFGRGMPGALMVCGRKRENSKNRKKGFEGIGYGLVR